MAKTKVDKAKEAASFEKIINQGVCSTFHFRSLYMRGGRESETSSGAGGQI